MKLLITLPHGITQHDTFLRRLFFWLALLRAQIYKNTLILRIPTLPLGTSRRRSRSRAQPTSERSQEPGFRQSNISRKVTKHANNIYFNVLFVRIICNALLYSLKLPKVSTGHERRPCKTSYAFSLVLVCLAIFPQIVFSRFVDNT